MRPEAYSGTNPPQSVQHHSARTSGLMKAVRIQAQISTLAQHTKLRLNRKSRLHRLPGQVYRISRAI
jgi:hypothetical protein